MFEFTDKGIIVKQQLMQNQYKIIHILSKHGRWSGLYPHYNHSTDLLTEVNFTWQGKNSESLGMYELTNFNHFLPDENEQNELYIVSLILCELALFIPERHSCDRVWYHFKHARTLLQNNLYIDAWMHFEASLIGIDITEYDLHNPKQFFQKSNIKLKEQYEGVQFLKMRNYMYNKL